MSHDDLSDIPAAGKGRAPGSDRFLLLLAAFAWGLLLALTLFGVPAARTFFLDFGVDLPQLTVLVLQAAPGAQALCIFVLLLIGLFWFVTGPGSRVFGTGVGRAGAVVMLVVAPLLMIGLTLLALVWPWLGILERLQG